jgi:hypothetical protein
MAGAMADTFGAPVLYTPKTGDPKTVHAILRESPIEVAGEGGHSVLIMSPTLQVPKTALAAIKRGDRVASVSAPDSVFVVVNKLPSGSPASDAMVICELERVIP